MSLLAALKDHPHYFVTERGNIISLLSILNAKNIGEKPESEMDLSAWDGDPRAFYSYIPIGSLEVTTVDCKTIVPLNEVPALIAKIKAFQQ